MHLQSMFISLTINPRKDTSMFGFVQAYDGKVKPQNYFDGGFERDPECKPNSSDNNFTQLLILLAGVTRFEPTAPTLQV